MRWNRKTIFRRVLALSFFFLSHNWVKTTEEWSPQFPSVLAFSFQDQNFPRIVCALLSWISWLSLVTHPRKDQLFLTSSSPQQSQSSSWDLCERMKSDSQWSSDLPQNVVLWGFPGGSVVKNAPANAADTGLTPGSGRSLEKEMAIHLRNPMDRRAWQATVYDSTKESDRT